MPPRHGRVEADAAAPDHSRRRQIELAAGRLFAARGYAGTRIDDVAGAVGVTKPIVYRHFDSKRDLYLALLERHERDLPSFFEGLELPPDPAPEALVRAILDRWLDYARENSHAWEMLFRDASGDAEIRDRRRAVSGRAIEVLAGFIAATAPAVPREQVEPTAVLITQGLAAMIVWWNDHPDAPKQVLADSATRVVLGILAADG